MSRIVAPRSGPIRRQNTLKTDSYKILQLTRRGFRATFTVLHLESDSNQGKINMSTQTRLLTVSPGKSFGIAAGGWGAMMSATIEPHHSEGVEDMLFRCLDDLAKAIHASKLLIAMPKRQTTPEGRRSAKEMHKAIVAWARSRGIACCGVRTPDIRKRFVINGKASDERMIFEAERRGFAPASAAEAYAIATFHIGLADEYDESEFLSPLEDFPAPIVPLH
ncbi:hypothetical protein [Mesorhizobium sp. Root552]|uniref:hypothetical protein n=1 Tax=Mesorhizobium sp. Root552 TaxID=1736555 RepID=UPI0012E8D5DC|nr:hypothetical protein [Mesorhizobium sp. Root552]